MFRVASAHYVGFAPPEDLVAEAFVRLWFILRRGGGPHRRLRPFLVALMRNLAIRRWFHEICGDQNAMVFALTFLSDPGVPHHRRQDVTTEHSAVRSCKQDAVGSAFRDLSQRDRELLVMLDVDGLTPAAVADRTGRSANVVASLAGRARTRLLDAYARAHVTGACEPRCQSTRHLLAACIQGETSLHRAKLFTAHLVGCTPCRAIVGGLIEVDHELAVAGSITRWMGARRLLTNPDA